MPRSYEDRNAKRIFVGEQNVSHLQHHSVEYGCQLNQAVKIWTRNAGFPAVAFRSTVRKPSLREAKQPRSNVA